MLFETFEELLCASNYVENPETDKITNVIYALMEYNRVFPGEVSFKYNFDYGDYFVWIATAKKFNDENNTYRALIDEEALTVTSDNL